jgi:beta-glucosidase
MEKLEGTSQVIYAQGCNWVTGLPNQKPEEELKPAAIEAARKADVVIMFMGITPRLEGEEMRVSVDGFRGGDRTRIDLPDVQQQLIKEIHALGKPVILVLLNGSAISINWEKENLPAIIEAWYPGQAAGHAIADIIFGDYNPAGRLPVTFYKTVSDLPDFSDYSMKGRTYRYFEGEPLFPFGYGLSYTTFRYSSLKMPKKANIMESVEVSVKVTNTGKRAGEEVLQLYLSNLTADVPVPLRTLKGFKRLRLEPGETKIVTFKLSSDDFSVIGKNNKRSVLPGTFMISVGGCSPLYGIAKAESGILKKLVELK